jgi:hypothetical protein
VARVASVGFASAAGEGAMSETLRIHRCRPEHWSWIPGVAIPRDGRRVGLGHVENRRLLLRAKINRPHVRLASQ